MIKTKAGKSKTKGAAAKTAMSARSRPKKKQSKDTSNSGQKTSSGAPAPTLESQPEPTRSLSCESSAKQPVTVKHTPVVPDGLPKKYFLKSTFNTHDLMHAPVEKTLKMLDKILAGERLFTM